MCPLRFTLLGRHARQRTRLFKLDTAVEGSLAAKLQHDSVGALLLDNLLDKVRRHRKEVDLRVAREMERTRAQGAVVSSPRATMCQQEPCCRAPRARARTLSAKPSAVCTVAMLGLTSTLLMAVDNGGG